MISTVITLTDPGVDKNVVLGIDRTAQSEDEDAAALIVSDARVKGVAQHINQAFTDPGSTLPVKYDNSPKVIPGNTQQGSTLSRLYSGANPMAAQAYADNRSAVNRACTPLPHAPIEECDEFPFASTWGGRRRQRRLLRQVCKRD
ncbi:hypothetical protein [Kitasatospora griseola]|uniref:hypothetical protein n=1 Tax=Kitasatospora griseola TaxID=2064 RepID=UPI003659DD54